MVSRREFLSRGAQLISGVAGLGVAAAIVPTADEADAATMGLAMKLSRAADWAGKQIGSKSWGTGTNTYCQRFAENAFGTSGKYASAIAAFRAIGRSVAPSARGQMVFFGANRTNGNWGHVGIVTGNDQFVSVTTTGVRAASISNWSRTVAPLIGSAYPPSSWPGR